MPVPTLLVGLATLKPAPGATVTFTVVAQISPSATGNLVNTTSVNPPTGVVDTNLANNTATDTDTLTAQADLSVSKDDGKTTAVPGTANSYTITVTNNGPSTVGSVTLTDTVPAALLKACKQAEIFAREGSNVARLNIKTANGDLKPSEVEMTATSEETGKNETIVEATVDGSGVLIAFNVKFLREALEVIKTPNVVLETSAANAPGVIRPVGDEQFLHVIMPMHLG